jgi:hypothetical protein
VTPSRRAPAPAPPPPTVTDLVNAPELAAIALLEHALAVVRDALLAEHPTLIDDFHRPSEQGRLVSLAHVICQREASLRAILARYRSAVREATAPALRDDADDDLF